MVIIPAIERLARRVLHARGFASSYVSTPAGRLHVFDGRGDGPLPTMVVLHGLTSAATAFTPVLVRLRQHASRVVAIDHPGHGFSDAPRNKLTPPALFEAVGAALDQVVPEPALLIGNSLGGAVALHRAIDRPDLVRALVLLSPAGARLPEEEWANMRSVFNLRNAGEARMFFDRIYHRPPRLLAGLLARELPRSVRRPAVRDILETAHNGHAPTAEELGALPMPILFVFGRSERLMSEDHWRWFSTHLPKHTQFERPHGYGHCPHLDAPAALAARIVAFARESGRS